MFPVRCYTCNCAVAHHHPAYRAQIRQGRQAGAIMDDLGVRRMCCRRMFLGYVDLNDNMVRFGAVDTVLDGGGTVLKREVRQTRRAACD